MLLEREKELEGLSAALTAARDGEGGLVLVEGEAGVGKSELLTAAEDLASELRLTALTTRATELEAEQPFGVVRRLLERTVTGLPRAELDHLLSGPAGLAADLFPALRGSTDREPEEPFAVVHGAYWLIARLATRSPLLLAVDDTQWLDERSLQVLRYLAGRVADLPVVLVAAGADGASAMDVIEGVAPARRLRPRPLSAPAVGRLVLADFPDADAAFVDACWRATNGVPLLVHTLLAAVRSHDHPPTAATAAGLDRVGTAEVARTVLTRLDAMPPGTPALARAAAVLGDDAELHHTAHLAGLDARAATIALDALCSSGIADPDEVVRFRHPIVRSALSASVPPAGRAFMHLRAAHMLLGEAATPERVAGHLLAAERDGRRWVVETLRRAATRAMAEGAPASAAAYLERALAEPPPPAMRQTIELELARAEAATGSPNAPARIRTALEPVKSPDERARTIAALVRMPADGCRPALMGAFEEELRIAHEHGADPEATRWLEATLLAEARDDPVLRERALRMLGAAGPCDESTPAGRALMAQRALEAALAGLPAEGVRDLASHALGRGALVAEDRPGGPHVAAAIRALALADDLQSAELASALAVERARDSGSPEAYARVSALRADVSLRHGSLAGAVADARAALEAGSRTPEYTAIAALGLALVEHGALDEAEQAIEQADLEAASAGQAAPVLLARARLHREHGRIEAAHGDASAAGALAEKLDADAPAWLPWRTEAALALRESDPAVARQLGRQQLDRARRTEAPRALGLALHTAGIVEDEIELLREAAATLERSHAVLDRARAMASLGMALRASRDPVAAREPLREALGIARRCGAAGLETRIGAELAASGERVRRADPRDAETLTPVERRIVDLATDGLTASEVADALFLTTKAVEWHLRSASRKLGAGSRTQLLESLSLRRD